MNDYDPRFIVIWMLGDDPRQSPPRACGDDGGRLFTFASAEMAERFADELRDHSLNVAVHEVTPDDIHELLLHNAASDRDDHVVTIEGPSAHQSEAEAHEWAKALGDRFMEKLWGEWAGAMTAQRGS